MVFSNFNDSMTGGHWGNLTIVIPTAIPAIVNVDPHGIFLGVLQTGAARFLVLARAKPCAALLLFQAAQELPAMGRAPGKPSCNRI